MSVLRRRDPSREGWRRRRLFWPPTGLFGTLFRPEMPKNRSRVSRESYFHPDLAGSLQILCQKSTGINRFGVGKSDRDWDLERGGMGGSGIRGLPEIFPARATIRNFRTVADDGSQEVPRNPDYNRDARLLWIGSRDCYSSSLSIFPISRRNAEISGISSRPGFSFQAPVLPDQIPDPVWQIPQQSSGRRISRTL